MIPSIPGTESMFKKGIGISSISVRSIDTVKLLVYTVITCLWISGYATAQQPYDPAVLLSCDCLSKAEKEIRTFPMHEPLYPSDVEPVTYTLDVEADNGVNSIELYEWEQDVDANGNTTGGSWGILNTWSYSSPLPQVTQVTHLIGAHQANKFISYKFVVTDNYTSPQTRTHIVSYAIDPYPPSKLPVNNLKQPAPVYVQGDVNQTSDIVFIPDKDITDLDKFGTECSRMITDAIFGAGGFSYNIRPCWWRFFNFFINPLEGVAKTGAHQKPANWSQLTFAESHAIMHKGNLSDHAEGTLFSTEQQNRGTMLHEAGHALFGVADEYQTTGHVQLPILPNIWKYTKPVKKTVKNRNKGTGDIDKIQPGVWKICDKKDNCQMSKSGSNITGFDEPCIHRVYYTIRENAGCPQPPLPP